jgi:tRNA (guanine-N7-)-methyltransferase
LFQDPHFKKKNAKRRIISTTLLAEYAYLMAVGGRVYIITDVKELYDWEYEHLKKHPLFEEVAEKDYVSISAPCTRCDINRSV